jgi:hypothetical protein
MTAWVVLESPFAKNAMDGPPEVEWVEKHQKTKKRTKKNKGHSLLEAVAQGSWDRVRLIF